jgi:hypothetical protein
MARIKLNLSRLSLSQKIDKARQIVKALTGNPDFPTPTPALADVTGAIDDLDNWFRVAAVGTSVQSGWSDPATRIAR